MARRRHVDPFECEIESLGKGGTGMGVAPDGSPVQVRFSPPGSRVHIVPMGKRKGIWQGRRTAMIRPPAQYATPQCAQFGLCGGCQLQELHIDAQRSARELKALADIEQAGTSLQGVTIHPTRSTPKTYGYRNKVELSFGTSRYLSEDDHAKGLPIQGKFLGFHAPGRFDRVVDAPRCELAAEPLNAVLEATRLALLSDELPSAYDVRSNTGFLRHLLLRHGAATGEIMAVLYTASPTSDDERDAAIAWGERIAALDVPNATITSVAWAINDGVADVARGVTQRQWGSDRIHERLGNITFDLSAASFFQTNTAGAVVLYDTIADALTNADGTLLDLYCGTGSIGLYLADRFDTVIGVEERPAAVADAVRNAERSGVRATFTASRVEDTLATLNLNDAAIVVDPPRAGLHPSVARALATATATHLVYVACGPTSLGRDAAILQQGHWRMAELWTVDLFPHTGHIEAVARFVRDIPTQ